LIEQWDGTSWSIVASVNPGLTSDVLSAVACSSGSQCWAVGTYVGTHSQTLIEQWDGSSWSQATSANTSATDDNNLFGVTCASASECWAVGYYHSSSTGHDQTLVELFNGSSWSIVPSTDTSSSSDLLTSVTCVSTSQCWAAGASANSLGYDQTLIEEYSPTIPPLLGVASRITHGSAGTFNINLPITGTPGIECRSSGGNYSILFTFANDILGCGSPGTTGGSVVHGPNANQCTENLTGVTNQQYVNVALNGVFDAQRNNGNVTVPMGVLIGDVNGSHRVDAADVSLIRQQTLQPITSSNFREDINASGRIDAADVSIARQQTLTSLP
jgi:hypothetical protein